MRNTAIYTELHKAHTTRMVRVGDTTQQLYAQQSIGQITGQYRTLPAIVSTGAQLDDAWQIVNLYVKQGNTDRYAESCSIFNSRYVGSVAVLGALDSTQAEAWTLRQFSLETGATDASQTCTTHAQALQLLLNNPASADELEIHSRIIQKFENRVTLTDVVWQGALLKTPERSNDLIHQMQILDRDGQLLDAMVPADMSVLLTELGATEAEYDALIVEYGTGDGSGINLLMNRLNAAMNKASVGKVKPVNVTLTKPFKRNGVTNVAVLFEFDDSQSVTIVFHNPDSTPGKLASGDVLTSWKIMLNKRDVTAALSPPEGENVQLPDLAKRILLVVEKNSARFQRANSKKAEDVAALEAAQGRVGEKKQKLTGLLAEVEALEHSLDESMKQTNLGNNESLKQGMANNPDGTAKAPSAALPPSATDTDVAYIKSLVNGAVDLTTVEAIAAANTEVLRISKLQTENRNTALDGWLTRAIDVLAKAKPLTHEPDMTHSPDAQFFQSIIDGTIDPLTIDMDHVIELAEKHEGNAEMEVLIDKALEAINQAEQAAAQAV